MAGIVRLINTLYMKFERYYNDGLFLIMTVLTIVYDLYCCSINLSYERAKVSLPQIIGSAMKICEGDEG